jgi:hypothetical protein
MRLERRDEKQRHSIANKRQYRFASHGCLHNALNPPYFPLLFADLGSQCQSMNIVSASCFEVDFKNVEGSFKCGTYEMAGTHFGMIIVCSFAINTKLIDRTIYKWLKLNLI